MEVQMGKKSDLALNHQQQIAEESLEMEKRNMPRLRAHSAWQIGGHGVPSLPFGGVV